LLAIALATLFGVEQRWRAGCAVGTVAILPLAYFVRKLPLTGGRAGGLPGSSIRALDEGGAIRRRRAMAAARARDVCRCSARARRGRCARLRHRVGISCVDPALHVRDAADRDRDLFGLRVSELGVAAALRGRLMVVSVWRCGVGARAGR